MVRGISPRGKRILDVGCGGGHFLKLCRDMGAFVKGVEPSPHGCATAASQGLDVFNGMLDEFETGERFDIITANQVLEHVPDPVATLTRMKTLLAPGGMVWIAVPNAACIWHKRLGWKWDGADLPYHLNHFTPQSLTRTARRAGLQIGRLYTRSEQGVVAYSMQKHLRENYKVPKRLTKRLYTQSMAARQGRELDARTEGDNLIAELVPETRWTE